MKTEFDDAPKTPPGTIITLEEVTIVRSSARTFVKGVVPHLPMLAKYSAPALGFVLLVAQHWYGKAETEHRVDVGYGTLAPASIEQAKEIKELKAAVAQLADSVAVQARLALASRPGFDDKGKPETTAAATTRKRRGPSHVAPPADPTIVKKVQEDAAKNQALKARLVVESPAQVVVPAKLPAEVPKPPEWPPPIPVQQSDQPATGAAGATGN